MWYTLCVLYTVCVYICTCTYIQGLVSSYTNTSIHVPRPVHTKALQTCRLNLFISVYWRLQPEANSFHPTRPDALMCLACALPRNSESFAFSGHSHKNLHGFICWLRPRGDYLIVDSPDFANTECTQVAVWQRQIPCSILGLWKKSKYEHFCFSDFPVLQLQPNTLSPMWTMRTETVTISANLGVLLNFLDSCTHSQCLDVSC